MPEATLEVPGAILSYHVAGSGPLLLFISGANGDSSIWRPILPVLSSSFTVCCYTRRGFKDSLLTSPQDYTPSVRLARDADDAAELIMHLSPRHPAYVLGSSSGGIVALELLRRHSDIIRMLICHEPPLTKALAPAEGTRVYESYTKVYETYRAEGLPAAVEIFAQCVGRATEADSIREHMARPENRKDVEYWLQHELTHYTAIQPDYEALSAHKFKIVMIFGRDSVGSPLQRTTESVGAKTGAQVRMVPGGHIAYFMAPEEFAEAVIKILLPTPPSMWPMFVP